jgi:uncharacterized protein YjeT (DUF2065 family)
VSFWSSLATGLALMLVFEGLMPLFAPGRWKRLFGQILALSDGQVRFFGLASLVIGVILLLVTGLI